MKKLFILILFLIPLTVKADITIVLDEDHQSVLQEYAEGNELTIEEYTKNIIVGWINKQVKGELIKEIDKKTIKEIKKLLNKEGK